MGKAFLWSKEEEEEEERKKRTERKIEKKERRRVGRGRRRRRRRRRKRRRRRRRRKIRKRERRKKRAEKTMQLTKVQEQASDPKKSIWLSASAGTGKTHVLIIRFLRLLLAGNKISSILCLTYTKAAANEMKERV